MSLGSLAYLVGTSTYKEQNLNRLNIYNEYCILLVSYLIIMINGVCVTAD